MHIFKKILIANRGEIALRILKTAKGMEIQVAVVFSVEDEKSKIVSLADEAYLLEGSTLEQTYLNKEKIVSLAKKIKADAIHPGYGFLSENPDFAELCEQNNIKWIGPSVSAMRLMADKTEARKFVQNLSIPVIYAVYGKISDFLKLSKTLPYPVLIKASHGGGGRGMKIVNNETELADNLEMASREAQSYFGNPALFIEKYFKKVKHVEIQVIGDNFGNVVHLFDRECSIQRRFQKIIEEAPSPTLTGELRKKLFETAIKIAGEINYNNAGTIEFLVNSEGQFYFLEMNTRIQVEHPVTEMITGINIIKEQILVASGNKLSINQAEVKRNGHAIECRICAEDVSKEFAPSPGRISLNIFPSGQHIRLDSNIEPQKEINVNYDSLLSKLIVWGKTREEARKRMVQVLDNYIVHGIVTNISFIKYLLKTPEFIKNMITTDYLIHHLKRIVKDLSTTKINVAKIKIIAAFLLLYIFGNENTYSRTNENIWKKIGFWRQLMIIQVILNDTEYEVEIIQKIKNGLVIRFENEKAILKINKIGTHRIIFEIDGQQIQCFYSLDENSELWLTIDGFTFKPKLKYHPTRMSDPWVTFNSDSEFKNNSGIIRSPLPGKVLKISVKQGDKVQKGIALAIIDSMKTENLVLASYPALIGKIYIEEGQSIKAGDIMFLLTQDN